MMPTIAHIAGPLYIRSYGLMIIIGLCICTWLIERHPLFKKIMTYTQFINLITVAVIAGIIGGRLLYVIDVWPLSSWYELIALWEGGFSALGTVTAVAVTVPLYLWYEQIPLLSTLDLLGLYAPLLWSIARIGCFLAGCCYGTTCTLPWAVTFSHPDSLAPLGIYYHPTQLYSSIALFGIWLFMQLVAQQQLHKPGQLAFLFLGLVSSERFLVDFWRATRTPLLITSMGTFSLTQLIALGLIGIAIIGFWWVSTKQINLS